MEFTGERYIPTPLMSRQLAQEHWHRYLCLTKFIGEKTILDAACGEGFGTNYLATTAKHVTGIDISKESIVHAKNRYTKENISFQVMGIDTLLLEDNSFDIIVSFETIEHVDENTQNQTLKEFSRVMKNNGILFISTPGIESPKHCKENEYHVKKCSYEEFFRMLKNNFQFVKITGQSVYSTSVIGACDGSAQTFNAHFPSFETPHSYDTRQDKYLIAACSNSCIKDVLLDSILIDRNFEEEKKICLKEISLLKQLKIVFKFFACSLLGKLVKKTYFETKKLSYIQSITSFEVNHSNPPNKVGNEEIK